MNQMNPHMAAALRDTIDREHEITAQNMITLINRARLDLSDEKRTQRDFAALLDGMHLSYEKEYRLGNGDIVDFFFVTGVDDDGAKVGVAIEMKLRVRKMDAYRQLARYAKHNAVKALILATNTSMGLPPTIEDKPVFFAKLGKAWI